MGAPSVQHLTNQRYAAELDSLICQILWHGYLNGRRRDQHVNDIFDLLSDNELNSGQINDLLELLERNVADIPGSRYLIAPTELSTLIIYSHKNHAKHTYRKQRAQISIEEGLVQHGRSAVASVAWIKVGNCGHWISYIVDASTSTISHGDSLGLPMPEDLRDTLQWWLHDLQNKMGGPAKSPGFGFKVISTTRQEDGFSCGILSTNSLFHYLLPCKFSLVLGDKISIKTYQIECTIEILKLGSTLVCLLLDNSAHSNLEGTLGWGS